MTSASATDLPPREPALRLTRPDEIIEAVPYLVGFHPQDSLVMIGLRSGRPGDLKLGMKTVVSVVARLDLVDLLQSQEPIANAIRALHGAGSVAAIALIYADSLVEATGYRDVVLTVDGLCRAARVGVKDWFFVDGEQWAAGRVGSAGLQVGQPHDRAGGTLISASATYAGLVARPDRAALESLLRPEPESVRDQLGATLVRARADRLDCSERTRLRCRRADIRAIFAATRTLPVLDQDAVVRFGAALRDVEVRDACWLATEGGRIEGEGLWLELSRRLPDRFRAPALFLLAWQQWRSGAGALAGMAVDAALDCEPDYHAAVLLDSALERGLDPFRTPRLRKRP